MGISGLLPLLKEIQVQGNIKEFRGKRLAVDVSNLSGREDSDRARGRLAISGGRGERLMTRRTSGCTGARSAAPRTWSKGRSQQGGFSVMINIDGQEAVLTRENRFVDYAMHRVRLLKFHGITPYIVFDGGPLPAKKGTEVSRAKLRAENLEKATTLESQGRWREAREFYTKCVDITPEMAFQLIKALRAENVEYVVAPYEADAQLCYLEREGYVDGIITEDSDLLVFGCRRVIFKLDGNGDCVWIHRDRLETVTTFPMHGWTELQFRRMAMLSGCDYIDNIKGLGLKTAHRLLRKHKTVEKVIQHVRLEGAMRIPDNYAASFVQAELAFIHQRVFDPHLQRLVPLNDFPDEGLAEEDERWIGLDVEVHIARGLARGDLHPETREPIEDQWPDFRPGPVGVKKTVLGASSTASDVLVASGPLDAFVSRTKRPSSLHLPKPIGVQGSGPSRLSDHPIRSRSPTTRAAITGGDAVPARKRTSKFFASREKGDAMEDKVEREKAGLAWETSDEPEVEVEVDMGVQAGDLASLFAGPSYQNEHVRSSSLIVSSLQADTSPARPLMTDPAFLTSPPVLSSPINSPIKRSLSSPPHVERALRSRSPSLSFSSPTRSRHPDLDRRASNQQGDLLGQEFSMSQIDLTPMRKHGTRDRRLSRVSCVLVPTSSPGVRAQIPDSLQNTQIEAKSRECELDGQSACETQDQSRPPDLRSLCRLGESSDSLDEEVVVTPSANQVAPQGRAKGTEKGRGKKRKLDMLKDGIRGEEIVIGVYEEDEEAESRMEEASRAERAKTVAMGWREKYALRPATPVGQGVKRRKSDDTATPSFTIVKQTTAAPISASAPRILMPKTTNPPYPAAMTPSRTGPNVSPKVKQPPSPCVGISVGQENVTPLTGGRGCGTGGEVVALTWKGLDRFKFAGKVKVDPRRFG